MSLINIIEVKEDKKRLLYTTLVSIFLHLFLVIIFIIFTNFKFKKDEAVVVKVQFIDQFKQELQKMSMQDRYIYKRKIEEQRKKIENMIQTNNEKKEVNKITSLNKKTNNDSFEKYNKNEKNEKELKEKIFFKNNEQNENKENGNNAIKLENELNNLDNMLDNLNSNTGTSKSELGMNGLKSNQADKIFWEGSISRELLSRTTLIIPEEFKKEGLKTSIKLRFMVYNNGLISNIEVILSSGFIDLDQALIKQFKNWKFKESDLEKETYGIIEINIGY